MADFPFGDIATVTHFCLTDDLIISKAKATQLGCPLKVTDHGQHQIDGVWHFIYALLV